MSNNYIDFLEDSLREQTKMTSIILAQLKCVRKELENYKTAEMLRKTLRKGDAEDDRRSNSEEP